MEKSSLIVSFSEISKWDTCKLQYYYSFVLGYRPSEESEAISNGIIGHDLLQSFYESMKQGNSKEEAIETVHHKAKIHLDRAKKNLNSKSLLTAWTLVDNYIRDTDFTSEAFLVENRFLIPVEMLTGNPFFKDVQIGFTPDIVFKRQGDFYDVEDSKFVGRAWSKNKLDMFPQAKLYQIFLRRMGYNVSRSGVRFFNVATGKTAVSYEQLSSLEEDVLIESFLGAVAEVVEYRNNPYTLRRTFNYSTCQYCAFVTPCSMEAQGKDASKTFKYFFIKSAYDYTK